MKRTALVSSFAAPLTGKALVPGDKSISHRALMLAGLAVGRSTIDGLLEGEDVLRTAGALRQMGVDIVREDGGRWVVWGRGVGGLGEPEDVLDLGNAGTGARLMMGVVASHPFTSMFTGDASLRSRPMRRVIEPLSRIGAGFVGRSGGRLPLTVIGTGSPIPIAYEVPVPSAQVKSALLLAGLNIAGETQVSERVATRDHTERMLAGFGADLKVETAPDGGRIIRLAGQPELTGRALRVPADPSSAAFPVVAASLVPGSKLFLGGIGVNPLRAGLFQTLSEMGADIGFDNRRVEGGEDIADLTVTYSPIRGIDVPPDRAPPILAVAASFATGTTRMRGLGELRVKESDRLIGIANGLAACGVKVAIEGDDLIVEGAGRPPEGGATIPVALDHRIAMSFLVMGMASRSAVAIDDAAAIDTSFPGFTDLMNGLGARITGLAE
jgi:3-phosphoshikimate 1-carboxyvinyltransferase